LLFIVSKELSSSLTTAADRALDHSTVEPEQSAAPRPEGGGPPAGFSQAARQAVLAELGIMALGKKTFQAVLEEAVVRIRAGLGVDTCTALELLPGGTTLICRAGAGWKEPINGVLIEAGDGSPAGYALFSSEPVVAEDFDTETRFKKPPVFIPEQLRSGMSLIIHGRDRPFGVFSVQSREPRKYTKEEVDYFQAAANVIALVAERFQTEEDLRRSEESFRSLIELAPDGVLIRRGGVIVYVNHALVRCLGHDSAEGLLGRPVQDIVYPEDRAAFAARDEAGALRRGGSPAEVRLVRRDGATVLVEGAEVPIVFDGRPSIASLIRDITERRKMEARFQQNERLASLGVLAAGVAHEINNPLMYVLGNLDLVRKGLLDMADQPATKAEPGREEEVRDLAEMVDKARDGSERVRRIVADLKGFSRSGGDDERTRVDVRRVVSTSINIARNEIRHRARLTVDEGDVPKVMASDSRLGQVFLNLLLNAAQAIPEGQAARNEITVKTRTDAAGRAVVEVIDTGAGIPKEILGKLFDPFFTTKPQGVGTGLGLAICHNIVSEHGGEITVESEVGKGSCFRVTLPPAPPSPEETEVVRPSPSRPGEPALAGRVLVIDDEPFIASLCRRILKGEHEIEVATSAAAALSHIESGGSFDVILCDLMMPDMSGMELFEVLERRFPALAGRVIFLSGGAFTPAAQSFRDRVTNLFLDKPCPPDVLRDTVRARVLAARTDQSQ
jgi:PAS domain S-box-containing protein